ncbi:TPA: Holliday junction branch migration DNA helicase RuvB [bacterium]|nr:Holliday junction branch migration DNA helicase RuvB [bacterium]
MKREEDIGQERFEDEGLLFLSLRPKNLSDYIGQKEMIGNLAISLEAAKVRGEPLDHIVFYGPPGLGKTTLAHIIAYEMGVKITTTSGPSLERAGDLVGILTNLQEGDILFIDEIHRLPRVVEEFLYPAMEDFRIDFVIDKGPYAKTINFNLKHFTLIGATTRAGLITAPLRERFGIFYHLDFYEDEDLAEIIKRSSKILDIEIDDKGAFEIGRRSRGTPRIANRLLKRVRDYAQIQAEGVITEEVAISALKTLKIDELGLSQTDRRLLEVIIIHYDGGPVGINALAATMHEESETIVEMVEPYLLKIGFLKRTSRGRVASKHAYFHLGFAQESDIQKKS